MKIYSCFEAPLKVFGVPFFDEKKEFCRLPDDVRALSTGLENFGRRCPGARIGFRTDAESFTLKVSLETLSVDAGMSLFAAQSVCVMLGERQNSVLAGLAAPPDYNTKVFEKTFTKSPEMQEVTLWLPRNERVLDVEISFPDSAKVEPPTPYKYGTALYYGSSITEGAHASNVVSNYVALLSRWLDLDFYNFGFSGSALGEEGLADYLAEIDGVNLFVLDYDHNAPTVEYLEKTHERFFKRIRAKNPMLPILMFARPNFTYSPDDVARRAVVEKTYLNALENGDRNVYYIDSEKFFGKEDRTLCTAENLHPNNLGFYRMATVILPEMKKILKITDTI